MVQQVRRPAEQQRRPESKHVDEASASNSICCGGQKVCWGSQATTLTPRLGRDHVSKKEK